jgi:hypothetical protein
MTFTSAAIILGPIVLLLHNTISEAATQSSVVNYFITLVFLTSENRDSSKDPSPLG